MDDTPRAFPPWIVGLLLSLALGNFCFAALWWAERRKPPPPPPPPVAPAKEALPDEELTARDRKIIELRAHNAELGRRLEEAQRRIAALTRPPVADPPPRDGNPDSKMNSASASGVHEQYAAWISVAGVPMETVEDVLRLVGERRVAGLSANLNEVDSAGMEELRRRRQTELERIERRIAERLGKEAYRRFAEFERRRASPAVHLIMGEE